MQSHNEQRSNQKQSVSSSQGRRKKRPSLIPLRNSATRKSQFHEKNHQNDNMFLTAQETNETYQSRQSGGKAYWSVKNENQLHIRTPSEHHSVYSSPRTPRSSPKDFESDTPFVPFVHQSLTRTVWQSEQIIPEEKEDIQRKESQTQLNNRNLVNELEVRSCIIQDQVLQKTSQNSMQSLNSNLYTFNFTKSPPKIIEEHLSQFGENPEQNIGNFVKKQLQVSVPICTTILPINFDSNNQQQVQQNENLVMKVTHDEYVSKAPIYYQQEIIASAKKSERMGNNEYGVIEGKRNWEKFSFSYLENISIRPMIDQQRNEGMPKNKIGEKFQIGNPIFQHINSTKKHSVENQTNFTQRLLKISKGYEEKIGFQREIIVNASISQTFDKSIQTEQQEDNSHLEVSMKDQLMAKSEDADKPEQKYSKNQQQIGKDTREQKDEKQNKNNHQKKIVEQEVKVLKSFACQYDQSDVGIKPSIKRVSIADSKNNVIFDIDSNNSTITCEMDDKKNKNKKKEKKETKSKPKDKVQTTKQKEQKKSQAEPIQEKTRKSKRNLNRIQAKKARA